MRPSSPPIYVLRHGETEWNREGRLQGHGDSPLTAQGVRQAAAQNAILRRYAPAGAVAISSDSGRSVATARRALEGLHMPLSLDPRLREVGLGDWQGMTVAEVEAGWAFLTEGRDPFDWKFDAPGGESLSDLATRAAAVLAG
jgi:broad specificity phosphatase PhoE